MPRAIVECCGANGATIAVLAHGWKSASPKTNAHLAQEILQSGGTWASEYPIDVHARPEQFVRRNRIQVGFAAGSIIVEGELKSGSMTQAEFCLRNGRVLSGVVPDLGGRDLGLVNEGTSMLVAKRKAFAIRNKDDYPGDRFFDRGTSVRMLRRGTFFLCRACSRHNV